jgi:CheY-like chemotaxis protein
MRILVIDDDSMAGEMTAAILEDMGHEIVLAENGMDAMEKIAANTGIEMLISDLNMPLLSGIDLFRELRAQGIGLPFILLTGDDPEKPRAEEPALDGCLLKDFSLEESLPEMIAGVLERRKH